MNSSSSINSNEWGRSFDGKIRPILESDPQPKYPLREFMCYIFLTFNNPRMFRPISVKNRVNRRCINTPALLLLVALIVNPNVLVYCA